MSKTYLSKNGYTLRKDFLTDQQMNKIRMDLTVSPAVDTKFLNKTEKYFIYKETNTKFYIPKFYGIDNFGKPEKILENYDGKDISLNFIGNLRGQQIEPFDKTLEACHKNGGGILSLMTGGGKTFIALKIICELKKKALIVVNSVSLLDQWKTEISNLIPDAKIGTIQGQKCDVSDCEIVISMLQSLSQIDYPKELFQDFGTFIVDETHHISSRVFSQALFKCVCKYTIGLSATPKRSDGLSSVFHWHLGELIYKADTERKGLYPIIKMYKCKSNNYELTYKVNNFTKEKVIQFATVITNLCKHQKRNLLIVKQIIELLKQDRKILLLSDRREHLILLYQQLLEYPELKKYSFGLFLGGMKIEDLKATKNKNLILATFKAFGEGVSEETLDTLILTSPKKYIGHLKGQSREESGVLEQIVGRIFRKEHTDKHPLIIDIVDDFSVIANHGFQRAVFYKSHFMTYSLQHYTLDLDLIDENSKLNDLLKSTRKFEKISTPVTNNGNIQDFFNQMTIKTDDCLVLDDD
jgi:hypothetical protein